jgi:hypothetical protein
VSGRAVVPYVVGQWVRGDRFYGREGLTAEVLDGSRDLIWVVGTRRIGKTSLLKQLELLAAAGEQGFFPLYWDLQGAEDPAELDLTFSDALLDAGDRLARLGIDAGAVGRGDLFGSLKTLRRRLREEDLVLLLLCDEAEELLGLQDHHPVLLGALYHTLRSEEGIRTVLASSVRLSALVEPRGDTAPLLHGFAPPLYVARLTREAAGSLIRQDHLPEGGKPALDAATVDKISERCGNHPFLLQLLTKRCLELGDLDAACEQVAADRMVAHLFSVDLDLLSASEKSLLPRIAKLAPVRFAELCRRVEVEPAIIEGDVERLTDLGLIARDGGDRLIIANLFLDRWLRVRRE